MSVRELADLIPMDDPRAVFSEIKTILRLAYPAFDPAPVEEAFRALQDLFEGRYPGYHACDTIYHDMKHNTDVFLATARLIHGAAVEGQSFDARCRADADRLDLP